MGHRGSARSRGKGMACTPWRRGGSFILDDQRSQLVAGAKEGGQRVPQPLPIGLAQAVAARQLALQQFSLELQDRHLVQEVTAAWGGIADHRCPRGGATPLGMTRAAWPGGEKGTLALNRSVGRVVLQTYVGLGVRTAAHWRAPRSGVAKSAAWAVPSPQNAGLRSPAVGSPSHPGRPRRPPSHGDGVHRRSSASPRRLALCVADGVSWQTSCVGAPLPRLAR